MPIRGAKVRRAQWFDDTVATLQAHGFHQGAPGVRACPGFYYFSRDRYVVRILPKNSLEITRPNGTSRIDHAPQISKVNFILDALVLDIEFP